MFLCRGYLRGVGLRTCATVEFRGGYRRGGWEEGDLEMGSFGYCWYYGGASILPFRPFHSLRRSTFFQSIVSLTCLLFSSVAYQQATRPTPYQKKGMTGRPVRYVLLTRRPISHKDVLLTDLLYGLQSARRICKEDGSGWCQVDAVKTRDIAAMGPLVLAFVGLSTSRTAKTGQLAM